MKTFAVILATAAITASAGTASAGGWKNKGYDSRQNAGLINVSPSVDVGDVLNGINVLNGSPILSGNVVSGILNGNNTAVGAGVLGTVNSILGHKSTKKGR